MSCVRGYRNLKRDFDFNFNASGMPDHKGLHEFLSVFESERGPEAIAVMVLHSWSMLKLGEDGTFGYAGAGNLEKFDGFLAGLSGKTEIVTAAEVVRRDARGEIAYGETLDFDRLPNTPAIDNAALFVSAGQKTEIAVSARCPICGAEKSRFEKMNGRQCPDCGSLERQRSLAVAYENSKGKLFDFSGKTALIFSPSTTELRFLTQHGLAQKISVDIRPHSKPDIIADICAMPQIATASQELVFASYVMPVVYDLEAALDEVARVISTHGAFISVEPLVIGQPTREIAEQDQQSAWYGKESLDKYRVGSFRVLGDKDYLDTLSARFDVERFEGVDPISGQLNYVHVCRRKVASAAEPPAAPDAGRAAFPPCTICGHVIDPAGDGNCPTCLARPRTRTLPYILDVYASEGGTVVAINPGGAETKALGRKFSHVTPAQRFAASGGKLDTLASASANAIVAVAEFEFAPDIELAIGECTRVLKDGGILLALFSPYRISAGHEAPSASGPRVTSGRRSTDTIQPLSTGRAWLLAAFDRAGLDAKLESVRDPSTGQTFDWFVGTKRVGANAETPAQPLQVEPASLACNVCGENMSGVPVSEPHCPKCGSPPRTRAFVEFLAREIAIIVSETPEKPLLAFAMTAKEREILSRCFASFQSVSLYGAYGANHMEGVDARDLSRFPDASFCGHFGILLFDYFTEHDQALAEAARVIEDGGILFHQISSARILEGGAAPISASIIQKRPGYFDYVPDGAKMASIKVGAEWFVAAMERAGFDASHVVVTDRHSGEVNHWFKGLRRPRAGKQSEPEKSAAQTSVALDLNSGGRLQSAAISVVHEAEKGVATPVIASSIPISGVSGASRIVFERSVPPLPDRLRSCEFAEHVVDRDKDLPTDQVIVVGTGTIGHSDDLGKSWRRIEVTGHEETRFYRCFTTNSGRHIVQAQGWLGRSDTPEPLERHGLLFVFSPGWDLSAVVKAGNAHWHGTASIDERNGVIMYAEYHDNGAKYAKDFASSPHLQSLVRPCSIWRSIDDGLSWEVVFQQPPDKIRHFHTVTADRFERDVWWASSGDLAHESRVWRSPDNGGSWEDVSDADPDIKVPQSYAANRQAALRFTDVRISADDLLWGADDLMGLDAEVDPSLPEGSRAGARVYRSAKSRPLKVEEVGYVGQPVRSMIDTDLGWILTTEAKSRSSGFRPEMFLLPKDGGVPQKLLDVENFRSLPTGFTHSLASKKAHNGTFFTFKSIYDLCDNPARIAQFKITYAQD